PSSDKLWDFIGLSNSSGRFTAGYGGEIGPVAPGMLGVAENPGFFMDPPAGFGSSYGASATGIPLLAGLQRISELQAGAINHVVAFELPAPAPCFRWPAQREDTLRLGSYVNPATSD